ncbi:GNAT family N-acetyltransferase [Roseibium sp. HPY-6]|uniref:GNAT family N-acetyltransferase n=1 Tax=Roseibium sp. HPY-6 TaxID=3229852 RepID=UPI00338F5870
MSPIAATVLETDSTESSVRNETSLELAVFSDFRDIEMDWRQLDAIGYSNPYQSPGWLTAWSETIGRSHSLEPVIVAGRLDGKSVLILPLAVQHQSGATTVSFLGHENGNQNTGIWDRRFYDNVTAQQIHDFLTQICRTLDADLLILQNVPEIWQGRPHPLVLDEAETSPSPIFVRDLPSDFEVLFKETHSKSSRKNLSRKQRNLQSVEGYAVVKAETKQDIRRGFDAFLEQRATRAQEAGIPNVFSTPVAALFLEKLIGLGDEAEAAPVLDLWFLEVGGKIRSTYLCAHHSETIFAYSNSIAHDEFLPNSPGLVLIKEIIERACAAADVSVLDLGLGEERYKTSWAEPVVLKDSLVAASFMGRCQKNIAVLRLNAKSAIRNSNVLWPLVRRMRKWTSGLDSR